MKPDLREHARQLRREGYSITTIAREVKASKSTALMKTQVKQGSHSRRNVLTNGVCGLRVISTPLVQHIYGAIQAYAGYDRDEWSVR